MTGEFVLGMGYRTQPRNAAPPIKRSGATGDETRASDHSYGESVTLYCTSLFADKSNHKDTKAQTRVQISAFVSLWLSRLAFENSEQVVIRRKQQNRAGYECAEQQLQRYLWRSR